MAFEWSEYAFGELCTITRGASPRPINAFLSKTGMPWIKIADATSSDSRFLEKTNECIKLEGVKSSVRVFPGDLILSNSATPGLPKFVMLEACIHDGWMLLRNFNGLNKSFAYWLLLNERKNLVAQGNGSVFTNLKTDILKLHRVRVPELATQAKIAQILDSIAAKVDLNRRISQTLEAMAQAIFKSWFVDFDPVKAKIAAIEQGKDPLRAAMRAISGKTDAELDQMPREPHHQLATTAALFPDAMEESELGEIPKGWQVVPLSKMIRLIGGGTPKRSEPSYWGGTIPWFSVKDVPNDGGVWVVDTDEKITEVGLQKSSTKLLRKGTTIISARGTVGKLAMVGQEMAMNQSCYGVVGAEGVGNFFNYFNLKFAVETLKRNTHGAVFDTITQTTFETVACVKPESSVVKQFDETVEPLLKGIRSNVFQSRALAELRDTLLPKLLSGELHVSDTEKLLAGMEI